MEIRQNFSRLPNRSMALVVAIFVALALAVVSLAIGRTSGVTAVNKPAITVSGFPGPDVRDRNDPYSPRDPFSTQASDPFSPRDPLLAPSK